MFVDVDQPIVDFHGEPIPQLSIKDGERVEKPPLTRLDIFLHVLANADELLAVGKPEKEQAEPPDAKKRVERYDLSMRLVKGSEVEITSTEAADLLDLINRSYGMIVYGQLHAVLEGIDDGASKGKANGHGRGKRRSEQAAP